MMTGTMLSPHEFLTQESRVSAISCLHRQLCETFETFNQAPSAAWYDNRLEPAFLHSVFDQLVEEVSLLTSDLELKDHDELLERAGHNGALQKKHFRPKSMTALIERYSSLIETMRVASQAAADVKDWGLTHICSDLAYQFEESLWYMVVDVQGAWGEQKSAMAM